MVDFRLNKRIVLIILFLLIILILYKINNYSEQFFQDECAKKIEADWSSMRGLFGWNKQTFNNKCVTKWDVSGATVMTGMFDKATKFNQNINDWIVGNVTNMTNMFRVAEAFNQPLNKWNVDKVTNMSKMFNWAEAFNQPLNDWIVDKVTNMSKMFNWAEAFNQDISDWNVSKVTNMENIFDNSGLSDWKAKEIWCSWKKHLEDKPKVKEQLRTSLNLHNNTDCKISPELPSPVVQEQRHAVLAAIKKAAGAVGGGGFALTWDEFKKNYCRCAVNKFTYREPSCDIDHAPLNCWNVSHMTNMTHMFDHEPHSLVNQPLNKWNVNKVTNMINMFHFAKEFNQNISDWNVDNVTNMNSMFEEAASFNQPLNWNVENVINMDNMFFAALAFDQDISGWEVYKVQSMKNIFHGRRQLLMGHGGPGRTTTGTATSQVLSYENAEKIWCSWKNKLTEKPKCHLAESLNIVIAEASDSSNYNICKSNIKLLDNTFKCPSLININCKENKLGTNYRGNVNKTKSGHPCLNWNVKQKYDYNDGIYVGNFDQKGLDAYGLGEHNSCRNPPAVNGTDEPEGPWCYIDREKTEMDTSLGKPNRRWGYCDIDICHTRSPYLPADPVTAPQWGSIDRPFIPSHSHNMVASNNLSKDLPTIIVSGWTSSWRQKKLDWESTLINSQNNFKTVSKFKKDEKLRISSDIYYELNNYNSNDYKTSTLILSVKNTDGNFTQYTLSTKNMDGTVVNHTDIIQLKNNRATQWDTCLLDNDDYFLSDSDAAQCDTTPNTINCAKHRLCTDLKIERDQELGDTKRLFRPNYLDAGKDFRLILTCTKEDETTISAEAEFSVEQSLIIVGGYGTSKDGWTGIWNKSENHTIKVEDNDTKNKIPWNLSTGQTQSTVSRIELIKLVGPVFRSDITYKEGGAIYYKWSNGSEIETTTREIINKLNANEKFLSSRTALTKYVLDNAKEALMEVQSKKITQTLALYQNIQNNTWKHVHNYSPWQFPNIEANWMQLGNIVKEHKNKQFMLVLTNFYPTENENNEVNYNKTYAMSIFNTEA
jgi:surface protein